MAIKMTEEFKREDEDLIFFIGLYSCFNVIDSVAGQVVHARFENDPAQEMLAIKS